MKEICGKDLENRKKEDKIRRIDADIKYETLIDEPNMVCYDIKDIPDIVENYLLQWIFDTIPAAFTGRYENTKRKC